MNKLKEKKEMIDEATLPILKKCVEYARDIGASAWLNVLPIKEQMFDLTKGEFRDALRLRYDLPLDQLPRVCHCGEKFSPTHAMSCQKGGFIIMRHDNIKHMFVI